MKVSARSLTTVEEHGESILPNYSVHLIEHSRNTATESKPHQGSSTVVEVIQEAVQVWNLLHFYTKLCTHILDIFSGNGLVVMIDRPFGYNYDIQPFLSCSVLQGGVVERKHDRKTETVAVVFQKHGGQTMQTARDVERSSHRERGYCILESSS